MQFNSICFLFCFLPAFIAIYAVFPKKIRSVVLILGSFVYYRLASNDNDWWVVLLVGITLFTYVAGLTLARPGRHFLISIYLAILTGILAFFKLYQGGRYLPSGMSFYLFQVAAYLIDVYRSKIEPENNPLRYAEQITMFPKLLSGPIMDPAQLKSQSHHVKFSARNFRHGLQLLILGLGLKVLLANRIGGLWAEAGIAGYEYISVPLAWLALLSYAMQLYFDFYGYSLMAMGLGKMLGFDLPRNFDSPYASKSVSEFYRRWHMTLGAWFREYLYIPLGGNRKGQFRTILNLLVVWLFTGLWHGIGGNYLVWAGFLFLLIVNERLWLGKLLKSSHVICHLYLVFVILLSWVPFAIGDWGQMTAFLGRLFSISGVTLNSRDYLMTGDEYFGLFLVGAILATPVPKMVWEKLRKSFLADLLIVVLFWFVVYYISTAAQDPFMYFQY